MHNTLNKRIENHVFVIDADYKEAKHNILAALIDNQATIKFTGIQNSDLKEFSEKNLWEIIWRENIF